MQSPRCREGLECEHRVGDRNVLEELLARLEVRDEVPDREAELLRVGRGERRERAHHRTRNRVRSGQRGNQRRRGLVVAEDELGERGRVAADRALGV